MRRIPWMSLPVACLLAACTPSPPDHERPPEPKVAASPVASTADAYRDAARDAAGKARAQAADTARAADAATQ